VLALGDDPDRKTHETIERAAVVEDGLANWPPYDDGKLVRKDGVIRVQWCHGAPGMVTTFADAPFATSELETLMLDAGRLVWAAGPLAKGSNLCHGTGGNGYAFLKLFRRTKDSMWLERARAFAMTAIAQCREKRAEIGRGRYSLWTGDVGAALFAADGTMAP
jgi:hypothetical protein